MGTVAAIKRRAAVRSKEMKVRELIEILEDKDAEADVFIMTQSNWPFENDLEGVAVREDFREDEPDEEGDAPTEDESGEIKPNDVFLVEGRQLRYGSKSAWHCVER
jgi:hypothetical protein